jgi:hypothetical protein
MKALSIAACFPVALISFACSESRVESSAQGGGGGSPSGAPSTGAASSTAGDASGGAAAATSSAGATSAAGATAGLEPVIPSAPAECPVIADGTITVLDQEVRLWTGPAGKSGPLLFYWHGTNSNPAEAQLGAAPALAEIQQSGGVVASFSTTTGKETNTGNKVWYTGDFAMADIILACAVEQGLVDARQVYTAGCSAGGLQAGAMVYGRSSYLAAAMPNSGGIIGSPKLQDPAHVPAVITTHGGPTDFVLISFAQSSAKLTADIAEKGGFVVNCDHGGDHCQSPPDVISAQWQFLKAHPFGVEPEPYAAGLPASFPDTCQIVQ